MNGVAIGVGVAIGAAIVGVIKKLNFGAMVSDGVKAFDEMASSAREMSRTMGITAVEASELASVFTSMGLESGMAIKTLSNEIAGGGESLAKLGINSTDANGALRSTDAIMKDVADRFAEMPDGAEKSAMAVKLFGRSGLDMLPLLNKGSAGIDAMIERNKALGLTLNETQAEMSSLAAGISRNFKDANRGIITNIGAITKPFFASSQALQGAFAFSASSGLAKLADSLSPQLLEMQNAFSGLATVIEEKFAPIAQAAFGKLEAPMKSVIGFITELASGLASGEMSFGDVFMGIFSKIRDAVVTMLPNIINLVVEMLPTILDNMANLWNTLLNAINDNLPTIIDSISRFLTDSLPTLISSVVQLIISLVGHITEFIAPIINMLPDLISQIITALVENLPTIIQGLIDMVLLLVEYLPEIITSLIEALPTIIEQIVMAILDNLPLLLEAGLKLIVALGNGLIEAVPELLALLWGVIQKLPGKILEILPMIISAGADLIRGFGKGIKDMMGWIVDQVFAFFGGVVDTIKGFLGIHSPSAVFAEMGRMSAEGYAKGWEDNVPDLTAGMDAAMKAVMAVEPGANRTNTVVNNPNIFRIIDDKGLMMRVRLTAEDSVTKNNMVLGLV
jgi:phage-related protein